MERKVSVKNGLRIKHDKLDAEIESTIAAAEADLMRMGVAKDVVNDKDNALVNRAICIYCLWQMTEDERLIDKYHRAYEIHADGLRKNKRADNV
jgi:rRNA-processing protein FCF1